MRRFRYGSFESILIPLQQLWLVAVYNAANAEGKLAVSQHLGLRSAVAVIGLMVLAAAAAAIALTLFILGADLFKDGGLITLFPLDVYAFFSTIGSIVGAIAALDARCSIAVCESKRVRTLLCAFLGAAAGAIASSWTIFSPLESGIMIGSAAGAVAGYFGWGWARYLDF